MEFICEGYGPGGAAVLVKCVTDNRSRTVAALRSAFARHGGNLGAEGSVAYLFNEVGRLGFPPGCSGEAIATVALEAGAEDVLANADGSIEVLTDPRDWARIRAALDEAGLPAGAAEVTFRSSLSAALGPQDAEGLLELLDALEETDGVQHVYSNAAIPADVPASL